MNYITYEGNTFSVEKTSYWYGRSSDTYSVSVAEVACEHVRLPETCYGRPVVKWYNGSSRHTGKNFDKAKFLYIPASLQSIDIKNSIFPELERVDVDPQSTEFYTDGRLIISRQNDELLYCPVCRGTHMEIPEYIKKIRDDAFHGTQYQEILFPKKEIVISSEAFRGSAWLERQGSIVTIGTMLYKFAEGTRQLTVPANVKRFHPDLFSHCGYFSFLATPILPGERDIIHMSNQGNCRTLKVTSENAVIHMVHLRKWTTLEEVTIPEGHKKYKTSDGVVYSRDGRTLVWYPCRKAGDVFTVPDGVRKIGESAFADQTQLKKILLPESVSMIGAGAFARCRKLESVSLPSGLKELPDSGTYQSSGVFAGCPKLKHIELPKKMSYLGSFAFYQSGLQSIVLGENLEHIGEYALMAENLTEIRLPSSVKRAGKGSLFFVEKAEVYEGTAKGLVAAINTHWPELKKNIMNMKWSRCRVTVLHKRGSKQDFFLIPGSLKKSAACHLESAWNGECIDYDEYDQCLDAIQDPEEKIEFAWQGLQRSPNREENIYLPYIRRVSFKIGLRLLETNREKDFLSFLKLSFLSEQSLLKLLKYSSKQGTTVCSAYITEALGKMRNKKKRKGAYYLV